MTTQFVRMALFVSLAGLRPGFISALQEKPKAPVVQRVASEGDLRARTSEEKARAEYFNLQGMPLLKERHIVLNVEPPGPAAPLPPTRPGMSFFSDASREQPPTSTGGRPSR